MARGSLKGGGQDGGPCGPRQDEERRRKEDLAPEDPEKKSERNALHEDGRAEEGTDRGRLDDDRPRRDRSEEVAEKDLREGVEAEEPAGDRDEVLERPRKETRQHRERRPGAEGRIADGKHQKIRHHTQTDRTEAEGPEERKREADSEADGAHGGVPYRRAGPAAGMSAGRTGGRTKTRAVFAGSAAIVTWISQKSEPERLTEEIRPTGRSLG